MKNKGFTPTPKSLVFGFTLIELLVVIAIIGLLSSIVLTSLNNAKKRGNDAKIKSQLSGLRTAAELYYDTVGNYGATASNSIADAAGEVCNTGQLWLNATIVPYVSYNNYPAGTSIKCVNLANATHYAVVARLSDGANYWCVDSRGNSKSIGAVLADGDDNCN